MLVFVGLLVAMVSSLGAPLIPTIAADYGVSIGDAQWSLTVTLVVGAVATPVVGRLGDGPRRHLVLLSALGALVLGNLLAAVPAPFSVLLIGRGLQGSGLALLPLAMSIARDHLDPERARSALATLSVTAIVGVGLGYPLTGLIAERFSFHVAFWFAAALGTVAVVLAALVVPASTHQSAQSFDLTGAALLGLALTGLLLGVSNGNAWGWASAPFVGLVSASILVLAAWAWHELHSASPLVNLGLLRRRAVLATNVTATLAGVGLYMIMSMVIRYVQTPTSVGYGLGASVLVAGLVLVPFSGISFLSSKVVTYLSRWVQADALLPLGVLALAVALVVFALFRGQLWESFAVMAITGVGVGSVFAVIPRLIIASAPAAETSSALALTQVLRTIGFSMGSALSATILTAHTRAGSVLPGNTGYTVGALVGAVLCAATAVVSWLLRGGPTSATPPDADDTRRVDESVDGATAGLLIYEEDNLP